MPKTKKNEMPEWLRRDLQRWEHWGPVHEFRADMARSNAVSAGVTILNYMEAMVGYSGNWLTFCAMTDVLNVLPKDLKIAIELRFGECFIRVLEKGLKVKAQSEIQIPCDVCGQLVRLWSDGTIVDHRNKRTHHRCKGSGTERHAAKVEPTPPVTGDPTCASCGMTMRKEGQVWVCDNCGDTSVPDSLRGTVAS